MQNKWQQIQADQLVTELSPKMGKDLALCIYASRLLGQEKDLVLHGGGNTSVKSTIGNIFREMQDALFVKASGHDLAGITSEGFTGLDLKRMQRFREVPTLTQDEMLRQMRLSLLDPDSPTPSVEAFLHAFIPAKFVVHTHPVAILALTNQPNGMKNAQQALGVNVIHVPYLRAGFGLAQETASAFEANRNSGGVVLLHHGLVTWGETAEEAYAATIRMVTQAETFWAQQIASAPASASTQQNVDDAWLRYTEIAPVLRGLLAERTANPDCPFHRLILVPWIHSDALNLLDRANAETLVASAPLTPDHLIRTKALPLFIKNPQYGDPAKIKQQITSALEIYVREYDAYFQRNAHLLNDESQRLDPLPRVVLLPGIGAVCAGINEKAAIIARDITAQSLTVKSRLAFSGMEYRGIEEEHLFEMEYLLMQQAKVQRKERSLQRHVAIVTGAAGAIGMAITEALLQRGCHVAVSDLAGEHLSKAADDLSNRHPHQVLAVAMDVTDPTSVRNAFQEVIRRWGGIDLIIINAGIAMVSSLSEMDLERFRLLERVNVEGALLVLRETAGLFKKQETGGDVVMISTKNVFAPGARFGAYSATKAAAHQLARIASLEFAELGVRVNMVAPDAVFSHGKTRSGLWAEVGPDRMKARGLNEAELEEYYRNRNLLKCVVTAEHVARAVLFFAMRQTPTTGATLPVDGGLPDSTPR